MKKVLTVQLTFNSLHQKEQPSEGAVVSFWYDEAYVVGIEGRVAR